MAGSFGSSSADDEIFAGINVTPLVDVVLVLLIIFMITAPVLYQSAIKVQLPKAKSGEQGNKSPLMFTLSKEGNLSWDKESMDWNTLGQRLKALGAQISEETATISADEATPHGTVIKLMDALRQAGLTRFALNVESSPSANPGSH
jgi:biopolymer transport protein ExbD